MARHRYRIYDDEYQRNKRPPKKNVSAKENTAAVRYYKYIIADCKESTIYPGDRFKACSAAGIQFYKTAFETMLWLESYLKNDKNPCDGMYCAIYQIKPLGPITEHKHASGLTSYTATSIEVIDQFTYDEMTHKIIEEANNRILPKNNPYPDFDIANATYNSINSHRPHMDNGMER